MMVYGQLLDYPCPHWAEVEARFRADFVFPGQLYLMKIAFVGVEVFEIEERTLVVGEVGAGVPSRDMQFNDVATWNANAAMRARSETRFAQNDPRTCAFRCVTLHSGQKATSFQDCECAA
jgi:hypothetical protein